MPCRSPRPLALAFKLQARVGQAIASLSASEHLPLHLLHHCLCLETAVRRGDGAAALHALGQLHAHAAQLTAPQRCRILAAMAGEPSWLVREAGCALLLASMECEGGLKVATLGPAMLTHLALPAEQQLRVLTSCRQLLEAARADSRGSVWTAHCKWLAAHAWNVGGNAARSARSADGDGSSCTAQLLEEALKLQALCGPEGAAQLQRMESAIAASGLAVSVMQRGQCDAAVSVMQHEPMAHPADALGTKPANLAKEGAPSVSAAALQSEGQFLQPRPDATGGGCHREEASPAAPSDCSPGALPAATTGCCSAQVAAGAVPAAAALQEPAAVQTAAAMLAAEPALASSAAGNAGLAGTACARTRSAGSSLPGSAVQAADAAAADMLSDSDGDGEGSPTWLDAVLAAQKRVLGGGAAGLGPAKRRALQPPALAVSNQGNAGVAGAPLGAAMLLGDAALEQPGQMQQQAKATENDADNADALSLCSS